MVKVTPGIIKNETKEIKNVAQQRINQIINQGAKEVERVLLKILREAIEDMYQTHFKQLGNFRKQQLSKIKKEILRHTICNY